MVKNYKQFLTLYKKWFKKIYKPIVNALRSTGLVETRDGSKYALNKKTVIITTIVNALWRIDLVEPYDMAKLPFR